MIHWITFQCVAEMFTTAVVWVCLPQFLGQCHHSKFGIFSKAVLVLTGTAQHIASVTVPVGSAMVLLSHTLN